MRSTEHASAKMDNGEQGGRGSAEREFRDTFPALARLIDASGAHKIEVTRSLSGDDSVVIVKRRDNGRGWGMVWRDGELIGMRGHRYVADKSDCSPSNATYLDEFERRLEVVGATLHEAGGYIDPMHKFAKKKPPVVRALAEHAF